MSQLHYLTVQDILWINFQLAKKVNAYNYANLEEATYYQYSYGESKDVPAQAARFLRGFLTLTPISDLNETTGLIGAIAFLQINGYSFDLSDETGATWILSALNHPEDFANRVHYAHAGHGDHAPSVRATIESVMRAYPLTIAALAKTPASV